MQPQSLHDVGPRARLIAVSLLAAVVLVLVLVLGQLAMRPAPDREPPPKPPIQLGGSAGHPMPY